ncbi:hypothetical protein [Halomonas sp. N3-2A]|uniref:hypothetical protein n=1 Tax=Halomonas sp. N3-2A TaxID=2014541 RepID=UPI0018DF39D6|nr:hypothetical protein [Halomonas sp. N3-2A]
MGADGSYTTTEDLSSLVDGEITVDASAEDRNGNPVSDSDSGFFQHEENAYHCVSTAF